MNKYPNYKKEFLEEREKLFSNEVLFKDSFEFCIKHSLLVDDYIQKLLGHKNFSCAVAAVRKFYCYKTGTYSNNFMFTLLPTRVNRTSFRIISNNFYVFVLTFK